FGQQSAGKSSTIKKMFSELNINLRVGTGKVTNCPIEIRLGAKYMYPPKIYVENFNNSEEHFEFDSIEQAEAEVEKVVGENIYVNGKIVIECNCDKDLNILDLPGYTNDTSRDEYFDYIKKFYLERKETIICHITRGE